MQRAESLGTVYGVKYSYRNASEFILRGEWLRRFWFAMELH